MTLCRENFCLCNIKKCDYVERIDTSKDIDFPSARHLWLTIRSLQLLFPFIKNDGKRHSCRIIIIIRTGQESTLVVWFLLWHICNIIFRTNVQNEIFQHDWKTGEEWVERIIITKKNKEINIHERLLYKYKCTSKMTLFTKEEYWMLVDHFLVQHSSVCYFASMK